jgi:hypothetical protein
MPEAKIAMFSPFRRFHCALVIGSIIALWFAPMTVRVSNASFAPSHDEVMVSSNSTGDKFSPTGTPDSNNPETESFSSGQEKQEIFLSAGWNLISLNVIPPDASFKSILASILGEIVLVRDQAGREFRPSRDTNQLLTWQPDEAYLLFVRAAVNLSVVGHPADGQVREINLAPGWNYLPYIFRVPRRADEVLGAIETEVVVVQDQAGNVYQPGLKINTIGEMRPGSGYSVFASSPVTLRFAEPGVPARVRMEMFNPVVNEWTDIRRLTFPHTYTVRIRPRVQDAQGNHLPEFDNQVTWRVRDNADLVSVVKDMPGEITSTIKASAPVGTFRMYAELIREGHATISEETRPHVQAPRPSEMTFYIPYADHAFPTTTVQVPSNIDATGATDVTEQLNAWLASVPNGRVILFPRDAVYRVEKTLLIQNRADLLFDGQGATLIVNDPQPFAGSSANRSRAHITLMGGERIAFRNLKFRGANPEREWVVDLEAQHAFNVRGTRDLIIENCEMTETYGDGVYLASSANRVKIRNNRIHNVGRQGIALTSAHDVLIENNHIHDIRRGIIDLEPNSASGWIYRVRIQNNKIGDHRLQFLPAGGGPGYVEFIEVLENTFENGGYLRVTVETPRYHLGYQRNNFVFRGNDANDKRADRRAIVVSRVADFVIEDNNQRGSNRGHHFVEGTGCRMRVQNNNAVGWVSEQALEDLCPN